MARNIHWSNLISAIARWLLLVFILFPAAADPGVPDGSNAKEGAELAAALRQGGLVIYFRHADTGPAYQERDVDLNRCDSQRNLNDKGRDEARQIGAQFKRLGIPVRTATICGTPKAFISARRAKRQSTGPMAKAVMHWSHA